MTAKDWQFHVEAKAGGDVEIHIYDFIGSSIFNDGVTAKDVLRTLRQHPNAKRISLRINSIGGIVDDSKSIVNLLNERRKNGVTVEAHVDGIAASAAAYITVAADKVFMPSNAFLMLHEVRGGARGTASEIANFAAVMKRMNKQMAAAFAEASARRGKDKTQDDYMESFAQGDRYLDADEAIAWGLADEKSDALDVAACLVDVGDLDDVPDALLKAPYVAKPALSRSYREMVAEGLVSRERAIANQATPVNQGKNALAGSGGASETPNRRSTMVTKEELKNQQPELYASIVSEGEERGIAKGIEQERKRVCAHLKLAKTCNAMDVAEKAIASGASTLEEDVHADYMAASMNKKDLENRRVETKDAGEIVDGAAPAKEEPKNLLDLFASDLPPKKKAS